MVPIFSPYFDEATFDRSIKNKTDFYQVVEFDASDPKTMTKYHYNYLPEIKLFNSSDSANVTITGMNKNFMLFDYTMNKFIFTGLTIACVGDYYLTITLTSDLDPTLSKDYSYHVKVNDITVLPAAIITDFVTADIPNDDNAWDVTVTYDVANTGTRDSF